MRVSGIFTIYLDGEATENGGVYVETDGMNRGVLTINDNSVLERGENQSEVILRKGDKFSFQNAKGGLTGVVNYARVLADAGELMAFVDGVYEGTWGHLSGTQGIVAYEVRDPQLAMVESSMSDIPITYALYKAIRDVADALDVNVFENPHEQQRRLRGITAKIMALGEELKTGD
jgi:hypothetical protein